MVVDVDAYAREDHLEALEAELFVVHEEDADLVVRLKVSYGPGDVVEVLNHRRNVVLGGG